jgi:SAM-dependent methyltransferase
MIRKAVRALAPGSGKQAANLNTRFYERIAPIFDSLYEDVDAEEAVRQWHQLIKRHAGSPKQGEATLPRLLDLGCGTGRYLDPWAAAGFSVTGVDASSAMIARARNLRRSSARRSQIRLIQSDVRKMSRRLIAGGPFDVVVAHFNFFNLFPPNEILDVLKHVAACTKTGATLFTDCASPALMPEAARERIVLANGEIVEVVTQPDPASKTVARSYQYRGFQNTETYWLHSASSLKATANLAGWHLESK